MDLVLIRGLPGSGKTTMARVLALVGYEHYEADQYFERDGQYQFNPSELPKAHAWCLARVKESMALGVSCVVANTFTRLWEMQPYIDAATDVGGESGRREQQCNLVEFVHGSPLEKSRRSGCKMQKRRRPKLADESAAPGTDKFIVPYAVCRPVPQEDAPGQGCCAMTTLRGS